ncbi:MAG: hypothetical protein BGP10_06025 [Rhodanobacter sp. 68-29]|uniref:beta-lactamase hydrolase domain-containing protein n=1 Tax=Rhodanobacter sp. PCA2 TaxID=2006117 RepID=UPI00086F3946|nr:sulfur transferase domain-containing protein [Rhodanobacter sp. PCA2]MBA2077395.1 serine/threonine protein phosphatase [Rhodanobacter sp. PCA2]MBN8923540.1 hypothetical protein [Rhodanobacter sp.]ODU75117.1 MAG: hypothetical protein ABT17_05405 [Rhodanobacter sp. SCN 69-32]OJY55395.1 MAG: hypothetical protein BGP10_06025 [Rhodanobacter sp. 68-29]
MNAYLPHQCCPENRLFCGGQPDEAQLADFAAAHPGGCVINLRPASETGDWDEAAVAKRLGLAYASVPVAGPQDLTQANAAAFARALEAHRGSPMLIHCATGQRVGALLALKAAWVDGCGTADALVAGRSGGLTALEPQVLDLLSRR